MQFHLTPIMIGVIAAALPAAFPAASGAAELGQVDVSDPQGGTQLTLHSGSTVSYTGTESAIGVSIAGNRVQGDGIRITATGVNTARAIGVKASLGGAVELTNSTVSTFGTQQNAHALYAADAGSSISGANLQVDTAGWYSFGAYAQSGGHIFLQGGFLSTAGNGAYGLRVEGAGSVVAAKSLDIRTTGISGNGVQVTNGGHAELTDVNMAISNGFGVSADGTGSSLGIKNTTISAASGAGVLVRGAAFFMQGGSVASSEDAVRLSALSGSSPSTVIIRDAALTSASGYGININGQGASVTLDNVSISALGTRGSGVWLPSIDTWLVAWNVHIDSWMLGIDNRAGRVTLQDGSVETHGDNAHGLYVSREYGSTASIDAVGTSVKTSGVGAVGALARLSGARVTLTNALVSTDGATAYGLLASGTGSEIVATGTTVATRGAGASGVAMSNRTSVSLDGTRLTTAGENAHGVWSYGTAADVTNNLFLLNGARVDTNDGVGLLASGGDHNLTLRDATIATRKAGDDSAGVLLQSRAVNVTSGGVTTAIATGRVNLDAARSILTGDIIADSGVINVALSDHSVLTGALAPRAGRIDSMSIDGSSAWNVRGDSTLGALSNAGSITFAPPTAQSAFKTLTVRDYSGGGTLVMNTQLGGDASPTDKLVIDGGTASGVTGMRILNAGGLGAPTQQGIRVVEAINGGSTTTDAFRLDPGSTGFRSGSGTLALNGYDYSLVRGGNQGVGSDWYLTSIYSPETIPPTDPSVPGVGPGPGGTDPADPAAPIDPAAPVAPPEPSGQFANVSPESGVHIGNQVAAARMFMHGLSDRDHAYKSSIQDADVSSRQRVWVRADGTNLNGLRMSQGDVSMDIDSSAVQIGGDLIQIPFGRGEGLVVVGAMAGVGDARVRSSSRLMVPGLNGPVDAEARGKVRGYSAGVYATAYENAATRMGAYADSWIQHGRYSNQISSELGSADYRSNDWTVSVESGYAFAPFAPDSALGDMVMVPQAQVAYTRTHTQDASLPGTTFKAESAGAVNTRAGVRVYPLGMPQAGASVRPFIEANWLHGTGSPRASTAAGAFSAKPSRNAGELKLGAEGWVGKSVHLAGHVAVESAGGSQSGYGGMLNLSYRW